MAFRLARREASATRPSLLVLVVLLTPLAHATSVELAVREAASVRVEGDVVAALPGGALRLTSWMTGDVRLSNVTGSARLVSYRTTNVHAAGSPFETPQRDVRTESFELARADLRLSLRDEAFALRVVSAPEGVIRVRGPASDDGSPRWLETAWSDEAFLPALVPAPAEEVDWSWEAGWSFLGDYGAFDGFPALDAPRASIEGRAMLQVAGGNVSFADVRGKQHTVRLGNWTEGPGDVGLDVVKARTLVYQYLVLDVQLDGSDVPLVAPWGVAAPSVAWALEGRATWEDASGTAVVDGRARRFEDARVALVGVSTASVARASSLPAAARSTYDAQSDDARLLVDGQEIAPAASSEVPARELTLAGAALALVAWLSGAWAGLAARVAAAFYTRIGRHDVLVHPTRARIQEIVEAEPGIHLRELHRRVGGAWGPFSFHCRLLEKMDQLSLRKEGRYQAAYARGAARTSPSIRGPIARQVLESLRARPRAKVQEVAVAAGISPQLARYHLRRLEAEGVVRRVGGLWSVEEQENDAPLIA